jgi:rootletin
MCNAFQTEREPETFSEAMSGHGKEKWVDAVTEKFSALRKSVQDEKGQCEDKLDKMRQAMSKLENEKRSLQEELARNESRATRLELQRLSLEGDLKRLQMILQEKDSHIQKLQNRCEVQGRNLVSLEERCSSLNSTIDQLNIAVERANTGEAEIRAEIADLLTKPLHAPRTKSLREMIKLLD